MALKVLDMRQNAFVTAKRKTARMNARSLVPPVKPSGPNSKVSNCGFNYAEMYGSSGVVFSRLSGNHSRWSTHR